MKNFQWDKLPHQQALKTVFKEDEPEKDREMLQKLQLVGIWMEMEEDFKAKPLVVNLISKF